MAKRKRQYHRRYRKFKLKQQTINTVVAMGLFAIGTLIGLSFGQQGTLLTQLHETVYTYFGNTTVLLPVVLFVYGFFFLGGKWFLARPSIAIGATIVYGAMVTLSQAGLLGQEAWFNLSTMLSGVGAFFILIALLIVGIAIMFNTPLSQLFEVSVAIIGTITTALNGVFLIGSKKEELFADGKKPLKVKGGQMPMPEKDMKAPLVNTGKQSMSIKEKSDTLGPSLVVNPQGKGLPFWEYPALTLLSSETRGKADRGDIKKNASIIEKTLESFGIAARIVEVNLGPAITQYALEIALGTKLSKITALSNDLALALAAPTGQIRIEAPIPGRNLVGIEIPNRSLEFVTLKGMLESDIMRKSKSKLTVALGLDVSGTPVIADIAKMPHILIAGTTGSGKSVLINTFICSLLFRTTPAEVRVILIDPKRVELIGYNGIPHLLTPVIVEQDKILSALKWAMQEMDRRYKLFAEIGVRNIDSYNEMSGFQALPFIVILIDELADLMAYAAVEVEDAICRIAQMARATGIHLILATQRPSVDVITGLIKANVPSRIAFNVSSMIDSRVIIDMPGAEKLLGRGDMLYIPPDQAKPTRIQGTFVSEEEVRKLVDFFKSKNAPVEYTEEVTTIPIHSRKGGGDLGVDGRDGLFDEAVRIICQHDRASASLLQRRLSIGYARAARILDQLENEGIVGPAEGSKPRDVLMRNPDEYFAQKQEGTTQTS